MVGGEEHPSPYAIYYILSTNCDLQGQHGAVPPQDTITHTLLPFTSQGNQSQKDGDHPRYKIVATFQVVVEPGARGQIHSPRLPQFSRQTLEMKLP
jgi:hypothetical protein